MARAVGNDWVYVLSRQEAAVEDAEAEKTVTAAAADDDDEYPDWYTPEEVEVEKTYDAYMAALDRRKAVDDDVVEREMDRAFWAYVAALDRRAAARVHGRLEIDEAVRAYHAARRRAAKILDGVTGGGRGPRAVVEKENHPCDVPYNGDDMYGAAEPGPYYPGYGGGSSAPPSLGSSYDDIYYDRYGFGFPGAYGYEYYDRYYGYGFPGGAYGPAIDSDFGLGYPGTAYGPATGYGYGGYAEPYASYVPPGYQTTAVYQAPPPAWNTTTGFYLPPPRPMPYVHI